MAGGPVAWRVTKSTLVGLSTAETETDAAMHTAKLSMFVIDVARQLRCPPRQWVANFHVPKMRIYVDNQAAIVILQSTSRGRNRHIDIRIQFLRQHMDADTFEFVYVASEDNESDVGTKQLDRDTMGRLTMRAQGYRRPQALPLQHLFNTPPQTPTTSTSATMGSARAQSPPPRTPIAPASSSRNSRIAAGPEAGPGDTKPISVITVDTNTAYPGISDSFTAYSDNAFPGVDMSTEYPGNLDVVNVSPANDYRK